MQNKVFRFNLDIKEKEFKTDFNLVQLDNTSMLVIKLFDEGNKLETTKEDRAEIAIDKNDNTFCVLPCSLYDNEVNCTLDSNALASPGWTNCEVRILNESKVLTSARFKIYIRENIVNNEKIKSTSEYKALEGLINEAKNMQESLKNGESVLSDVNELKKNLIEIKETILNKSEEIDSNLAVADEKINLIKTYISKSETAIENLTNNQNKIENLSKLLTELEKIKLTLDEINNSINKANTQQVELDKSTENAKSVKSNLDASVTTATNTNTTLKATDTEAKNTESLIRDLINQLDLSKDEINKIIANGDLSKYITEPKLQEVLEDYVNKRDLGGFIYEYVKEESIKIKTMTAVIDQTNSNPLTCITYEDDAKTMEKGSAEWNKFFDTKLVLFKDGKEIRDLQDSELNNLKPEDGDVMVKFRRMGLNIKTVGDKVYVSMTNDPYDDNFKYYAHARGTEKKEAFYLGAYLGFEDNGKLRSIQGVMPTDSKTIGASRALAQANGSGYEQMAFYQLVFLQAMYILKYGNLDSQTAIGKGLTGGDYTNTGTTNGKGIDFGSTNATLQMRFQYLEDFYGNKYEWIDGFRRDQTSDVGTATGGFNNDGENYKSYEIEVVGDNSYPKKVQGTSELGFVVKESGASQSTYFCDYQSISGDIIRGAFFGGSARHGNNAGAFLFYCYYSINSSFPTVGSRLMFL